MGERYMYINPSSKCLALPKAPVPAVNPVVSAKCIKTDIKEC